MTKPLLSIIIVSFNSAELTLKTLESVTEDIAQSSLLKKRTEVWVVDNFSSDHSVKSIKAWQRQRGEFLTSHLIENQENVGFANANNQALTKATGEFLLLLNSDTIVKRGALEKLVTTMDQRPVDESTSELSSYAGRIDKLGILAATLLNSDGTLQPQGGSFPSLRSLASHMLMLDDLPVIGQWLPSTQHTGYRTAPHNGQHLIVKEWVGGTAMLIRREVIEDIGLLDPNIFMYGEDVEFCMRARHHHWDVAIHPTAAIEHLGSGSSSPMRAIIGELNGYLYIWAKHKPDWQLPWVKLLLQTGAVLRIFVFGTMLRRADKAEPYRRWLHEVER